MPEPRRGEPDLEQSGGRRAFEAAAGDVPGRYPADTTPPAQRRGGSGAELTGRFAADAGPAGSPGRGRGAQAGGVPFQAAPTGPGTGTPSGGPKGGPQRGPQHGDLHTRSQSTGPHATGPNSAAPHSGPQGASHHSTGPHSAGPQGAGPHSAGPQGAGLHGAGPQGAGPHGRSHPGGGPQEPGSPGFQRGGPQGASRGGPQQRGPQGGPGGRPSPYGAARQPGEAPPKPFVDLARFDPNPATTYRGTATTPGAFDWESTTQVAPFGLLQLAQAKRVRQLRLATIIFVVLAVVSAPAAFFVIREVTRDPVFVELDNLNLPEWAARNPTDGALGSRWCIRECRSRQRTWESARGPEETNRAFVGKLKDAGWVEWDIPDCQAEGVDGIETCWQRDEYVLDLWVRAAVCDVRNARPTVNASQPGPSGKPTAKAPASPTAATQEPGPQPSEMDSPGPAPTAICPLAVATIKVFNRISYGPGGAQGGG